MLYGERPAESIAMSPPTSAQHPPSGDVRSLLGEYRNLLQRYGLPDPPGSSTLAKTNVLIGRRAWRTRQIREELKELDRELRWLESEIHGLDKGRQLLLSDAIDDIRNRFNEGWSPTPVLGYRIWSFTETGFTGIWSMKWDEPHLDAVCTATGRGDEVPHTDGRCGQPPCGIYAAKRLDDLLSGFGIADDPEQGYAVGLVELRGKVVEHERGYRAAHATVIALAVGDGAGPSLLTDNPDVIRKLFAKPATASVLVRGVRPSPHVVHPIGRGNELIVDYLEQRARRHQWT